jgi:MFS family permease
VQGLAAAALAPAALSLVTATFAEGPERNRAMGIWGAVAGSGAAVGVLLGGVLTTALGCGRSCSSTCRSASPARWPRPG